MSPTAKPCSPLSRAIALVAITAQLLGLTAPVGATVRTWNNAAGGSSATTTNWSPNGLPVAADNLVFSLAGTYTVDLAASTPLVASHVYRTNNLSLTTSAPHVVTSSLSVGSTGSGTVTMKGVDIKAGGLYLGNSSSDYGHLTITSTSGFPNTSSRFEQADTGLTQTALIANDGKARLEVFGGSQLIVDKGLLLANTAASRCTLNIAGRNPFAFANSSVLLPNPRMGVFRGGLGGQAEINVTNSGFLRVAGEASLGGQGTGVGHLNINGTTFGASAVFDGPLYVGGNQFLGTPGGSGVVVVGSRGVLRATGPMSVGDPEGGGSSSLIVLTGGRAIAVGGLRVENNGSLVLGGGVTEVAGGKFTPPTNTGVAVGISGGAGDAPELWLMNGQANDYVSHFNGILIGGTAASGLLRVSQPGTTWGTVSQAPVYVGSWFNVPGALEVDSSATFEASGHLDIGTAGPATASVTGGATVHAGQTTVGAGGNALATLTVKDPGSSLRYTDVLSVGGNASVPNATSDVVVDSGAVVTGVVADSASAVVVVQTPQGHLRVLHGASLGAGSVRVLGTATLDSATVAASQVSVLGTGEFGGHGVVTGGVTSTNIVHGTGDFGTFGSLRLGGAYSQAASAKLKLRLGTVAGLPVNDTLVVAGNAALNGIIAVEPDPNFVRTVGDSFTVVTHGARTGTFSGLTWNGVFAGQLFDIVYRPNKVVLIVKAASVGVEGGPPSALRFAVRDNGVHPSLALDLPMATHAKVDLFDLNGRRVALLHDGALAAGRYSFAIDAAQHVLSPGVYFARASLGTGAAPVARVVILH